MTPVTVLNYQGTTVPTEPFSLLLPLPLLSTLYAAELAYDLDLLLRTYVKWFVLEKETLVRVIPYDWF